MGPRWNWGVLEKANTKVTKEHMRSRTHVCDLFFFAVASVVFALGFSQLTARCWSCASARIAGDFSANTRRQG